jgi:spore coat protein CotH
VRVVDGFDEADLSGVPLEAAAQFWPREPSYFPCTVELGEHRWTWVGVRYKGNNSLASSGESPKKPLRMDFDQFEDEHPETEDQRFFGFKQLSWTNNVTDPSFLRQRVAAEIFRRAGVPTTQAAFYEVRLDPGTGQEQRLGLYTATELPRAPFLEANFEDADGHLYKPDGRGAHFASYHPESYHPKHDEGATDFGDIEGFVEALHGDQSDRALWRSRLEARFDMEGFLRFLAVNQVMTNWDTYGALAHNFYLYAPASDGRLRFIPWDFDLALGGEETDLSLAHFDGQWPLLQAIARDPVYFARYAALVREVVEGPFAQEEVQGLIRAQSALVRPYALAEGKTEEELDEAVGQLLEIVATRHEKARAFLAEWEAP